MVKNIHQKLLEAREYRHYKSARDFALSNGLIENTYRNHEAGKRGIDLITIKRYAKILNLNHVWFITEDDTDPETADLGTDPAQNTAPEHRATGLSSPGRAYGGPEHTQKIPIYGFVAAANGRETINPDMDPIIGWTEPLPNVRTIRDAFALQIQGDSMEPRYRHGEIVVVNRHKLPNKGDDCIVECMDGTAEIKQFLRDNGKEWVFHQYNPPRDVTKPKKDVKGVYAVAGRINY